MKRYNFRDFICKKNIIYSCFIINIILVTLIGCHYTPETNNQNISNDINNTSDSKINDIVDAKDVADTYYTSYYNYGEHPLFDEKVYQNMLDHDYLQETANETVTRADLEDCEKRYIELWKEELNYSLEVLYNYLNDNQKAEAEKIISNINKEMHALWDLEYSLKDVQYEGHDLQYHRLFEEKEWYRDMTMRVKYLIFMFMDQTITSSNSTPDVMWYYTGG